MKVSSLILKMEGIAGTDISEVIEDMCETSNRLQINIQVNVNGCHLLCFPGTTPEEIKKQFLAQQ